MAKQKVAQRTALSRQEIIETVVRGAKGNRGTIIVLGPIGCGKSSMMNDFERVLGDTYSYSYVDMTLFNDGDNGIPLPDEVNGYKVVQFMPNTVYKLHEGKPVVLFFDEIFKARTSVINSNLRVMLEQRLFDYELPEGSIVLGASNLQAEGVGDNVQPHARNRITVLEMRNPTADEWNHQFAIDANIHPVIMSSVREYPAMLGDFRDHANPESNPYIYDPRVPRESFTSPRSLHRASDWLHDLEGADDKIKLAILEGTVGLRAAYDIMAIHAMQGETPAIEDIIQRPGTAKIPKSAAAIVMTVYKMVAQVSKSNIAPFMAYLQRLDNEPQALFSAAAFDSSKASVLLNSKDWKEWATDKAYLYTRSK